MKCTRILSIFLVLIFGLSFVYNSQSERTMKSIKFRKWFSKKLFDQAKGSFDHARRKVDDDKKMILLAKDLVNKDEAKAKKAKKGESINNENSFEQLIVAKIGQFKALS